MFEEVTKREGGKRAAKRSVWLAGSTVVQISLVAAILVLSATTAHHEAEAPLVDVRLVKAAPPPPPPPSPRSPPAVPAPKLKPREPKPEKPKPAPKPRPAMVQPKEIPKGLKPPGPKPAEPEEVEDGVEGGVVGGVAGSTSAGPVGPPQPAPPPPPPPLPPKPKGPVKFDTTMTAPKVLAAAPLEYTQQALEREVEGTMVVECIIRVDGTVHDCKVRKGLPFMDGAVVGNLERRRYEPATQGGNALDVQYTFTIRLRLPK